MATAAEGRIERAVRLTYGVLVALVGIPTLLLGVLPIAAAALLAGIAYGSGGDWGWWWFVVAALVGLAGVIGWAVLAWRYLRGGAMRLRTSPAWMWFSMALGCAVAVQLLTMTAAGRPDAAGWLLVSWAPPMLLLAAWLLPAAWPWRGANA